MDPRESILKLMKKYKKSKNLKTPVLCIHCGLPTGEVVNVDDYKNVPVERQVCEFCGSVKNPRTSGRRRSSDSIRHGGGTIPTITPDTWAVGTTSHVESISLDSLFFETDNGNH